MAYRRNRLYGGILLISLVIHGTVNAQMQHGGFPATWSLGTKSGSSVIELPAVTENIVASETSKSTRCKALRFAIPHDGTWSTDNAGYWSSGDNDLRIWRCTFHSSGAYSMSVIFDRFAMSPGTSVFVFTPDRNYVLGAYTAAEVSPQGTLTLPPLPGEYITVEADVPGQEPDGKLVIGRVASGFMDVFPSLKESDSPSSSGTCNVDINCTDGAAWQFEKRGVCKLLINGDKLCSGMLVNTTVSDGRPYLLTAGHCIDSATEALRTVFIFNYERTECGLGTGVSNQTVSGSELLATVAGLDFSLVKLYMPPPVSYKPVYLGWNIDTTNISSGVTIHHPAGDVKKISIDEQALTIGDFGEDYDSNSHWKVAHWDTGDTEGGSSGAPLFDQNHKVIGTLTGGDATCTFPYNDFFARIDRSWNDYPDSSNQLKYWLDPQGTGLTSVTSHNPYNFTVNSCDTVTHIETSDTSGILCDTGGWGYTSGHNYRGIDAYAERFIFNDSVSLTGVYWKPGLVIKSSTGSYLTLFVAKGGMYPDSILYSEKVLYKTLSAGTGIVIPLWKVLAVKDTVYAGFTISYANADTFAMVQSLNRLPGALNTVVVRQNNQWVGYDSVFSSPASFAIGLQVCDLTWLGVKTTRTVPEYFRVYPVPGNGNIHMVLPSSEDGKALLDVFDITGRPSGEYEISIRAGQAEANLTALPAGWYVIRLFTEHKKNWVAKLLIVH